MNGIYNLIPAGYFVTVVATECPICNGTGWKPVTDSSADVSSDAAKRPGRVTRCDCILKKRTGLMLQQAYIPARYEHCELREFVTKTSGSNPSLEAALLAAESFVKEYPIEKTGLLFIGPIGVGKTHLAVGIVRELVLQKSVPCLFYDYRELLKEIQNSYNPTVNTTEMAILRPVFEAEVLVLDELGAVKPSEWVWDTVSLILNTRYNDKRTTIITTNFPDQPPAMADGPRDLTARNQAARAVREETLGDRIGERMRSRLHEMCRKVEMQGSDFRQRVRSTSLR
ncbi:MAG TPA: ATP-binding protein [Terriglobales bacterium]|jgi:DNA replication protein DnaC|nr:ATP-binding protein [Terriglobales bacterium]